MAGYFAGKRILVGVCGSIAAFKVAGWVSSLVKEEAQVTVLMTGSAQKFVTPLTFKALSADHVYTDMFSDNSIDGMSHIQLGQDADLFIIAPASANTIAKLKHGMADDLLTTTALVTRAPVIVCPAMNPSMFSHPSTQKNIRKLNNLGYKVIDPDHGKMACKDEGQGRLPEWQNVREECIRSIITQDLKDKKILVTAGPTREPIDPARFISNKSSGKMGYSLAKTAWRRGADVTLVSGPSSLDCPYGVDRIRVETAKDMADTVLGVADQFSIVVKSAAVSDFAPSDYSEQKVKKTEEPAVIKCDKTTDILYELGQQKKEGQFLVGFAAETENHLEEGRRKLQKKNLDLIAVNNIGADNTGFEVDTNKVTLLGNNNSSVELPHTTKEHTADLIWDNVLHSISQDTK